MFKITNLREYTDLSFTLRCMAERYHEDRIANACSDLAYRMEWMKQPITLVGIDSDIAKFALDVRAKLPGDKMFTPRGKLYSKINNNGVVEPDKVKPRVSVPEVA